MKTTMKKKDTVSLAGTDMDITVASYVPPPIATTTTKKKDLVPLLDRKGETYEPPDRDACSQMCVALPEFKEFAKYTSTVSHQFQFAVMQNH